MHFQILISEDLQIKDLDPHLGNEQDPVTGFKRFNIEQSAVIVPEYVYGALKQVSSGIAAEPGIRFRPAAGSWGGCPVIVKKRHRTSAEQKNENAT